MTDEDKRTIQVQIGFIDDKLKSAFYFRYLRPEGITTLRDAAELSGWSRSSIDQWCDKFIKQLRRRIFGLLGSDYIKSNNFSLLWTDSSEELRELYLPFFSDYKPLYRNQIESVDILKRKIKTLSSIIEKCKKNEFPIDELSSHLSFLKNEMKQLDRFVMV